jgi:hypothetical protein
MNIRESVPPITELEKISTRTDTRDYLAKAAPTTEKLKDWLVVDVDAHVNETAFWSEITDRIDNDVLRYIAESFRDRGPAPGLLNANGPLYQDVAGRTSRSWPSRLRPGCIVRCSLRSAPWMRSASTTWWCSRPPCSRSACIRRSMPKWRSATPITAG